MKIGTINSVAHRVNFQRWGQIIKEFVFYTPVIFSLPQGIVATGIFSRGNLPKGILSRGTFSHSFHKKYVPEIRKKWKGIQEEILSKGILPKENFSPIRRIFTRGIMPKGIFVKRDFFVN